MHIIPFILFVNQAATNAQETRLYFESYTTENGLAQNLVRKTIQSSSGYIWLITAHGLSRFDANSFKNYNYNKKQVNGLASDFLTDIIKDSDTGIWLASFGNGLIHYSPEKNIFKNFVSIKTQSTDINQIIKIFIDQNEHIWLGTRSSVYLSKYKENELRNSEKAFETLFYKFKSSTPEKILCFFQDSENNMWIGTNSGLFIANTQTKEYKKVKAIKSVNSIIEFKKDNLLLATDSGAYLYNIATKKTTNFFKLNNEEQILQHVKVDVLAKDTKGNIWLGTYGEGLINFNLNELKFYKYKKSQEDKYSIQSNLVSSLYIDSSNTLFVGLRGAGLNITKIRNGLFKYYRHKKNQESISSNIIWQIIAYSEDKIWIGTQNGLNLFNPLKNSFKNNFNFPGKKISFIRLFKKNKNSFLCSTSKFLASFNFQNYHFKILNWEGTKNLGNNYISGYYKKNNSVYIIAFYGKGLVEYKSDGSIKRSIKDTENLYIKYMLAHADSILFLATTGEGLIKYNINTDIITKYTTQNGLNSNNLNFLYKDSKQVLWIAGSSGVNKFDLKKKVVINSKDKVSEINYAIYSIIEDKNQNIWMGSNAGLLEFNKTINRLYVYKSEQGLQSNEFNTAACAKTPDGHLIFGGVNGFNYFHPDSMQLSKYTPKIIISSFSLFYKELEINKLYKKRRILNKTIAFTDTIRLNYNENVIGISFSALDFANSKNIIYAYRLKGFNKNWITADAFHKSVSYTNLTPGTYVFQVKSTNADRIWTNNIKNLYIIIKPAFWQQSWFKILALIFILMIIYFYIRLRTHIAITKQKKLAALVKEQTFEITIKNMELKEQTKELNQLTEKLRQANTNLEKKVKKRTKKLKKALKAAGQAENLISSFLSNISHEIRTPMNAISGFSQLITETELNNEEKQAYGQIIDRNINMLLAEFDNIMNIAKLHSGKYKVYNSSFSLKELFDELFVQFNKEILMKNKEIKLIYEVKSTYTIFSDKLIIQQIMHQLLDNAVKYTEKGIIEFGFYIESIENQNCNTVLKTIYNAKIKPSCELVLFVKDTGLGISKKQQKWVFDAFRKIESKEKLFRGSGLGLSIIKKFSDIFNAEIILNSEVNKGTKIFIKIPLIKI